MDVWEAHEIEFAKCINAGMKGECERALGLLQEGIAYEAERRLEKVWSIY